ncbi:MAG: FHA domain-containing protein [Actinomycetota bacterium]
MAARLEIQGPDGPEPILLGDERVTLGAATANDVVISWDRTVSRLHAVLERIGEAGWVVKDLSSRNGTFVNGERIWGEQPLYPGDEIRVGGTRILFRSDRPTPEPRTTVGPEPPPAVTPREREVLMALCRPMFSGDVFTEPASIRDIARELVISDAAVKQHLLHLYDKFDIRTQTDRRRVRLANDALRRNVVRVADLRGQGPS